MSSAECLNCVNGVYIHLVGVNREEKKTKKKNEKQVTKKFPSENKCM